MIASRVLVAAYAIPLVLCAQTAPVPPAAETAETASHDNPVTFQAKVNLVPVPVVVRDRKSQAIGTLTKDDFHVFDNGKLQVITRFSIEKGGIVAGNPPISTDTSSSAVPAVPAPAIANHFVAYVFDDLHFNIGDLMQARLAALKHFDGLELGTTRAAVYTTSGVAPEDFTSDRVKLQAALNRLTVRSRAATPQTDCPYLSYWAADLIVNHNDGAALQSAVAMSMSCPIRPVTVAAAEGMVRAAAFQAVSVGESQTQVTLGVLRNLVKRIGSMPGQRTLVLVSPGFIFPSASQQEDVSQLIDLAIRMNVVINSIDGRGLYVDSQFDASRSGPTSTTLAGFERDEARASGDTLGLLAEGTGGTIFSNNNDLLEGFRRTGSQPEFTYMLGFSPQNLKNDGKFHSIKVKLKDPSGLSVQARRGFFGPKHSVDAVDKAKQDIEEALFSREEITDFPLTINTQFFKSSDVSARVSVFARVGLSAFHFRKVEGRNKNELTVVTGLFDRDGNYMSGKQTTVELRFRDENLERRVKAGISVRASFDDVKPGTYVVRLVARDAEGQMISATNGAIEVP